MRIFKTSLIAVMAVALVLSTGSSARAADSMTNEQLAQILSDMLKLQMPDGSGKLSDAELFEVQSNMLAENGVTQLTGVDPGQAVTRGMIATILYEALVGPDATNAQVKITYLSGQGLLPDGKPGDVLGNQDIITSLNIPQLSTAVAEAYSSPGGPRRRGGRTGVLSSPANPAPVTPVAALVAPAAIEPASQVVD